MGDGTTMCACRGLHWRRTTRALRAHDPKKRRHLLSLVNLSVFFYISSCVKQSSIIIYLFSSHFLWLCVKMFFLMLFNSLLNESLLGWFIYIKILLWASMSKHSRFQACNTLLSELAGGAFHGKKEYNKPVVKCTPLYCLFCISQHQMILTVQWGH